MTQQFRITYGLGGGYNTHNEEVVEAYDLEHAAMIAYTLACEEFESYGVFEEQNPDWEEDVDNGDDYDMLCREEVERWVHYDAVTV